MQSGLAGAQRTKAISAVSMTDGLLRSAAAGTRVEPIEAGGERTQQQASLPQQKAPCSTGSGTWTSDGNPLLLADDGFSAHWIDWQPTHKASQLSKGQRNTTYVDNDRRHDTATCSYDGTPSEIKTAEKDSKYFHHRLPSDSLWWRARWQKAYLFADRLRATVSMDLLISPSTRTLHL